ncbi:MAG: PIN domain-containing protein [Gammaproteobacteria bacterium]|nr:PIN domain-containing protein [Gammaproteobacteria bacterium]MCY4281796.1 PIN domain-containing protein [Gammaproteobacteria bacterium]MCY4337338.1 PIN domain-containing protein [Gammaproteobacteria bacterium]
MSVDRFIDTNVFVYLFDETSVEKSGIAEELIRQSLDDGSGCISYQVVQETINVLVRKLEAPPQQVRLFLDNVLEPLWRVNSSRGLLRRALELQSRYRFGFYDSLIIAAALDAGCSVLYTEDLQHGQQIEGLTIINPFHTPPSGQPEPRFAAITHRPGALQRFLDERNE